MVAAVYRVALVATLAALTALLVVALPQGYAQEAPPAPMVEGFPVPQDEDQAQNLRESIAKGCTAANLFEDLSCKGPEYRGYELISEEESSDSSSSTDTVSQQDTSDCFVADVTEVSEQEVIALQSLGFYGLMANFALHNVPMVSSLVLSLMMYLKRDWSRS